MCCIIFGIWYCWRLCVVVVLCGSTPLYTLLYSRSIVRRMRVRLFSGWKNYFHSHKECVCARICWTPRVTRWPAATPHVSCTACLLNLAARCSRRRVWDAWVGLCLDGVVQCARFVVARIYVWLKVCSRRDKMHTTWRHQTTTRRFGHR